MADFAEQPVHLHLEGTIDLFGAGTQASYGIELSVRGFDATGQATQSKTLYPADTTGGHFSLDTVINGRTTTVYVSASARPADGYGQYPLPTQQFDGLAPGSHSSWAS